MPKYGRRVQIACTCRLDDGTTIMRFGSDDKPLEFVLGSNMVLKALSTIVSDMVVGETRSTRVSCDKAYGFYDESLIEAVPLEQIPDAAHLPFGSYVIFRPATDTADALRVKVLGIEDDKVLFDHNHELADEALNFEVTLLKVFGEGGSNIENELYADDEGCGCGCGILESQIGAKRHMHDNRLCGNA